jgi:hypothetical protein
MRSWPIRRRLGDIRIVSNDPELDIDPETLDLIERAVQHPEGLISKSRSTSRAVYRASIARRQDQTTWTKSQSQSS